jgi:GT2 family glycosyltransferase
LQRIGSACLPPAVSIITVYYNTPADLLKLHESIKALLPAEEYEWIVADNHSFEDLSAVLAGVKYLRFTENFGFGKANNLAAGKASAPYLFFLNPDCILIENPLPPLLQAMKSVAVVGPQVLNPDGSLQLSFGPFLSIFSEIKQRFLIQNEDSALVQNWMRTRSSAPFFPDYVSGCALMIGTELFRTLGGFDDQFFLYEEDVDLCKRVTDRGLRVMYVPSARVEHTRNQSVRQQPDRVRKEYRKSQLYYYRKHRGLLERILLRIYHMFTT